MKLSLQKRLASKVSGASPKRIRFDTERLEEIKDAITKADIKGLINSRAIIVLQKKGTSRVRVNPDRKTLKKGKHTARQPGKKVWMHKVRALREMVMTLRDKELITKADYHDLYMKIKGGFFRTKRHMKLYIDEKHLLQKQPKSPNASTANAASSAAANVQK